MLLEPAEYTDGGRMVQRGLRSIMERRYRERRATIKENVHDEVEEKWTTAIERFLCAVEECGSKPTSLKTCVLCKPWHGRVRIDLMVQRRHSASAATLCRSLCDYVKAVGKSGQRN